jgi:hypothetical protein
VILAAVITLISVAFAAWPGGSRLAKHDEVEAPAVIEPLPAVCPDREEAAALRRAVASERAASAYREQFAFRAADGVKAIAVLDEAAACYAQAARTSEAERLRRTQAVWREAVEARYAAARLTLRRSLDQRRPDDALGAVRELEGLLSGRSGPYADWLKRVRTDQERAIARRKP